MAGSEKKLNGEKKKKKKLFDVFDITKDSPSVF